MRSRWPLATTLAALAIGAAWFAWPGDPALRPAVPPADAPPHALSVATVDATAPRTDADLGEVVDGDAAAVPARSLRLEVVLMPEGSPAAGAEVLYWPRRDAQRRRADERLRDELADLGAALRRSGCCRAVADERGHVDIEVDARSELAVVCGDHYGEVDVGLQDPTDELRCRVELWHDVTLRVEVRDTDGRACPGIAVEGAGVIASRRLGDETPSFDLGATDANGRARLAHVQTRMSLPGADVLEWSVLLRCTGTHLHDVQRLVEPAELASPDPIVMTVPVGGTVELEVVGSDGEPQPCQPALVDDAADLCCTPTSWGWRPFTVIAQVPLGHTWRAYHQGLFEQQVVGPTRSGETVHVRIVADSPRWRAAGSLRRLDGWPVAGTWVELECTGPLRGHNPTALVDDNGRFRLVPDDVWCVERCRATKIWFRGPGTDTAWGVPLDREMSPGLHDLGAFEMPTPAGEVVLATVEVRLDGRNVTGESCLRVHDPTDEQRRVPVVVNTSRERIELRTTVIPSVARLECTHPDAQAANVPLTPGSHHVIELRRGATLTVAIEPPPLPRLLFQAVLVPVAESETFRYGTGVPPEPCRWQNVPPGAYRLRLLAGDEVLHEEPCLALRAGKNVWPADGTRFDLRRAGTAFRITARDAAGNRVDDVNCLGIAAGSDELPPRWEEHLWTCWVVTTGAPRDVLLRAPGCVPKRITGVRSDAVVVMQRLTSMRIEPPTDTSVTIVIEPVRNPIDDALLRQFDVSSTLDRQVSVDPPTAIGFWAAPGAVLEVRVTRNGVASAPQQVVVEERGVQLVDLR